MNAGADGDDTAGDGEGKGRAIFLHPNVRKYYTGDNEIIYR